jgi:hypothetical protein
MIFSKSQPQHLSINQNLRNVIEFGYLKFYVEKNTTFTTQLLQRPFTRKTQFENLMAPIGHIQISAL